MAAYPPAKLTGIHFGLTSKHDVLKTSVFEKEPRSVDVCDSRLGLPNADAECTTCGEKFRDKIKSRYGNTKCEGHFGHIMLPYEVYHPNYVRKVADIFNKICLKCLHLKVEQKARPKQIQELKELIDEMNAGSEFGTKYRNVPSVDGKDKDFHSTSSSCTRVASKMRKESVGPSGMQMSSNGEFSVNSDVAVGDSFALQIADIALEAQETLETLEARPALSQKSFNKTGGATNRKVNCKYCKRGKYPKLNFKVENCNREKGQRKNNVVEKIRIELMDDELFPADYLKVLGKEAADFDDNRLQYLLPSKALEVLRKMSNEVVACMKIDTKIARPEAFVLDSILVPPNCNRVPQKPGESGWKHGSDEVTKRLRTIARFKGNSSSKSTTAASIEELQSHISHYFRLKGAPKVKGNSEPFLEYTRHGQSRKEVKRSGRNKLHDLMVAKISDFSARAVLTGDAFLSLDEIGIPVEMSTYLTVNETITQYNAEKLQREYSSADGEHGIVYYVRSGIHRHLKDHEPYSMEMGDVIGRPIVDGDVIFCNRPPSVHKHSLIGLKVRLSNSSTFSVNPLLCPPMGADFDGDCLAIFIPQSIEARAEAELLMADNQMLTSHGHYCTFRLTQDSLLAAHMLLSSRLFLKREIMEQGCMWSNFRMPKPAIFKSPKGSFFTSAQFFQLPFPADIDYDEHGVLISQSEIMKLAGELRNSNAFLQSIIQKHGYKVALNYLGSCQMMLVQWLSHKGFSTGLRDVYETCPPNTREDMKNEIRGMISGNEGTVLKHLAMDNSMMEMVTAGSKGSVKKFVEQFACLGHQPLNKNHKHASREGQFISSSFVEGLRPDEFMMHTQSYRDAAIFQGLKASEPGVLFKNLMLFFRDVYLCYDDTVRSHVNRRIFQFSYGGYKEMKEIRDSVPSLAGESVGILAAMAIVQPAYEMLLESGKAPLSNISPLEYLQETLYCRKVLKLNDRKVILYTVDTPAFSSALQIRKILQHVNLDMLRISTAVFYADDSGSWEGLMPAENSPWVVHLSLSMVAMNSRSLSVKEVVQRLRRNNMFQSLSFYARDECNTNCPGWCSLLHSACISFCITCQQSSAETSFSCIVNKVIPCIQNASIIGDSRIESVSILPSSESWAAFDSEVAIEVVFKKAFLKKKTDAWDIVKQICLPVFHLIDWSRSMPCSVQGIAKIYGIEAAHHMVFQRLRNVLSRLEKNVYREHASLITDIMTNVGSVIGLTPSGMKEFLNRARVSAPLTQALFGNLVQHIQNAAFQGKDDDLSGTLPSICCGKLAPVGTGANFELLWRGVGCS